MWQSIEPETHNRAEEQKVKMGKFTRGKRKGEKNFIVQTTTLTLITMKP
jgi:hypothetical protein